MIKIKCSPAEPMKCSKDLQFYSRSSFSCKTARESIGEATCSSALDRFVNKMNTHYHVFTIQPKSHYRSVGESFTSKSRISSCFYQLFYVRHPHLCEYIDVVKGSHGIFLCFFSKKKVAYLLSIKHQMAYPLFPLLKTRNALLVGLWIFAFCYFI